MISCMQLLYIFWKFRTASFQEEESIQFIAFRLLRYLNRKQVRNFYNV